MAQQLHLARATGEGVFRKLAKQSWHRSVANCDSLQFAPTTPEKFQNSPYMKLKRIEELEEKKKTTWNADAFDEDEEEGRGGRIGALGSTVEGSLQVMSKNGQNQQDTTLAEFVYLVPAHVCVCACVCVYVCVYVHVCVCVSICI